MIVVEHDIRVVSCSDWIIDIGPGAGEEGRRIVFEGTPSEMAKSGKGKTSEYLMREVVTRTGRNQHCLPIKVILISANEDRKGLFFSNDPGNKTRQRCSCDRENNKKPKL